MSQKYKRVQNWQHCGFMGSACMMQAQLNSMLKAQATTDKTREIAALMLECVTDLKESLKSKR